MRFEMIEGETINILFSGLGTTNPNLFAVKFQVRASPNRPIIFEKTSAPGGGINTTANAFTVAVDTADTIGKAGIYAAQAVMHDGASRIPIEQFDFIIKPAIAK